MKIIRKIIDWWNNWHRDYAKEAEDAKKMAEEAKLENQRLKEKYGIG